MLTKLLFGESGTHTGERCQLLLTPCYFVPALTLLDPWSRIMMALPLVTLHLAFPRLPLPCIAYQIHCFANTASAYKLRSTCIVPWLSPFCFMARSMGHHPRRSPAPRRVRHALAVKGASYVCSGSSTSATIASVNARSNQLHHLSYDNAACAGLDISTACHPPYLFEEPMTSTQTSMAGRDLEAAPKLDGLIQSSTTSILLVSTPPMLPRWSLTDPSGRPFIASGLPTLEPEQGS